MSKPITYVLAVTDRSGSMYSLVDDVRGGFNTHLADLKKASAEKGLEFRMSVTIFDTEFTKLAVAAKLEDVPELTTKNYFARGGTALLDAVGRTVTDFEATVKLRKKDKVILFIQTDGAENSSREFSWEGIKNMLEEKEKTGQWSINYVGQGVDSWDQADRFGSGTHAIYAAASAGDTQSSYRGRTMSTIAYAAGASPAEASQFLDNEIKKGLQN